MESQESGLVVLIVSGILHGEYHQSLSRYLGDLEDAGHSSSLKALNPNVEPAQCNIWKVQIVVGRAPETKDQADRILTRLHRHPDDNIDVIEVPVPELIWNDLERRKSADMHAAPIC